MRVHFPGFDFHQLLNFKIFSCPHILRTQLYCNRYNSRTEDKISAQSTTQAWLKGLFFYKIANGPHKIQIL